MAEDGLPEVLEIHIRQLQWFLGVMQDRWLTTQSEGHDTTNESISQVMGWIADLESALERHRSGNA